VYVSLRDRPAGVGTAPAVSTRVASTVVLLGLVSLLTDVSSEMVAAILPLYLTTQIGLSYLAYGVVDGAYQGVSALVRIGGGLAADRSRRSKWIATAGYAVSAASRLALLAAHGFGGITAVVTVDRIGKGLRTAPRDALIAAASPPELLARSFGVHRMLDTTGAVAGPVVAVGLLALAPGRYDAVFVVSFAVAMVGVSVIALFVPDRRAGGAVAGISSVRLACREVVGRPLRRPLAAAAVLGVATVADGFLYLAMQRHTHLGAAWFPLLYVGTNVVYLVLAVPLGRLADRFGRAPVFIGGQVALLGCYLAVAGLPGPGSVVLGLALLGTAYAATDGVLAALVSRLVAPAARASGIAAAQSVVVLARLMSSVAVGALWAAVGSGRALVLMAVVLGGAIPVAGWLLRGADR
jgi:MFS family permease